MPHSTTNPLPPPSDTPYLRPNVFINENMSTGESNLHTVNRNPVGDTAPTKRLNGWQRFVLTLPEADQLKIRLDRERYDKRKAERITAEKAEVEAAAVPPLGGSVNLDTDATELLQVAIDTLTARFKDLTSKAGTGSKKGPTVINGPVPPHMKPLTSPMSTDKWMTEKVMVTDLADISTGRRRSLIEVIDEGQKEIVEKAKNEVATKEKEVVYEYHYDENGKEVGGLRRVKKSEFDPWYKPESTHSVYHCNYPPHVDNGASVPPEKRVGTIITDETILTLFSDRAIVSRNEMAAAFRHSPIWVAAELQKSLKRLCTVDGYGNLWLKTHKDSVKAREEHKAAQKETAKEKSNVKEDYNNKEEGASPKAKWFDEAKGFINEHGSLAGLRQLNTIERLERRKGTKSEEPRAIPRPVPVPVQFPERVSSPSNVPAYARHPVLEKEKISPSPARTASRANNRFETVDPEYPVRSPEVEQRPINYDHTLAAMGAICGALPRDVVERVNGGSSPASPAPSEVEEIGMQVSGVGDTDNEYDNVDRLLCPNKLERAWKKHRMDRMVQNAEKEGRVFPGRETPAISESRSSSPDEDRSSLSDDDQGL